jgi:hypothetical protein
MLLPLAATALEEERLPPLPPGEAQACPAAIESRPVVSYRISSQCRITDIQAIGEYRYGHSEVERQVRGFERSTTRRQFHSGDYRRVTGIEIELHRALDEPAHLVCVTDMMGREVLSATLVRARPGGKPLTEPVSITDGRLPDLGVFTHTAVMVSPAPGCAVER